MNRVQLALNVEDVEAAVAFYSKLFDAEPAKRRPGYANFAISRPPLKLVLLENPGQGGTLNHLGVEVVDTEAVDAAQTRLATAGLASVDERDSTCCYAQQDKFWVEDAPDGERWEVYTVLADSPTFFADPAEAREPGGTCCARAPNRRSDHATRPQPTEENTMNHPSLVAALAQEHLSALRTAAARDRLARIATCCRPSVLAGRLAALRGRLTVRTGAVDCCA